MTMPNLMLTESSKPIYFTFNSRWMPNFTMRLRP
jgi:hypothetical protein